MHYCRSSNTFPIKNIKVNTIATLTRLLLEKVNGMTSEHAQCKHWVRGEPWGR